MAGSDRRIRIGVEARGRDATVRLAEAVAAAAGVLVTRAPAILIRRVPPFCKRELDAVEDGARDGEGKARPALGRAAQPRAAARRPPARSSPRAAPGPASRRWRAGPGSESARSTGTSRPARRCSRRSTAARSTTSSRWPSGCSPSADQAGGLRRWLHANIGVIATKRGMIAALAPAPESATALYADSRRAPDRRRRRR